MRNALDSSNRAGRTYYQGIALGEAEVVAALMNPESDPETIQKIRGSQLRLGLPLGSPVDELQPEEIKRRTAAPCR